MRSIVYMLAIVIVLGVIVLALTLNIHSAANDKPSIKNIWEEYNECDVDALLNVVREQIKERYPFEVRLAFPTYLPEGYRLIAMDFVVDGPDQPNGYVTLYYWDKGDCEQWRLGGGGMDSLLVNGGFVYSILLPMEKGPVQKGTNDVGVDQALADYQSRKDSIRAQMQEVRLSNGYRAVGWEPFMGVEGMAIPRCPEYEDKKVMEISIDDADNVTCRYDDGTTAEGSITYTGEGPQAGMVTYLHEEYNLGIIVRGGLPLDELAKIAGSVKVLE